ncbi:hypothetical protein F5Y14DRAFT_456496 [Nemania sp. NC0429]|nr:hypothetical protein F5Y14DRAFT_456496 [Nemania sp. NC0429]
MHDDSLPPVDTLSLSLFAGDHKPSPTIDVQNDYGTPNFLFFYFIPPVPDSKESELADLHADFRSWISWELSAAEDQLQKQLKKGTLPNDDSIESRATRCSYRAKVVAYLRENSEDAWLLHDSSPTPDKFSQAVKRADLNGAIRKAIRDHYLKSQPTGQLAVLLNIISGTVAGDPNSVHKFYLTTVHYNTAQDHRKTRVLSFTITQAPGNGDKDTIGLTIDFLDFTIRLNMKQWDKYKGDAEDMIEAGNVILKEMELDFFLAQKGD